MRLQPIAIVVLLSFPFAAFTEERLTYDAFIKVALEQNLSLKIEAAKAEAARKDAGRLSVPPPMVAYMKMTEQSGSSAEGFEVNQSIPFPTKITKDRSARKFEARAQEASRLGVGAETLAMARLVYFRLWASQQRKAALAEKRRVIEGHIQLTRAGVRSDSFLKIHLIKNESDLDLLDNELIASDQNIREKEVAMAVFLNLDPSTFQKILEEPPPAPVAMASTNLQPHQLEFAKLRLEGFKAKEQAAKSSWFPDLYLQYKEIGKTQMMPGYSQVSIGLTLPFLFPWEPSSTSGSASARRLESELEYQRERRTIESERTIFLAKTISLKKQLDNITQKLLPRAEKRVKLIHNFAPRDMETLQDRRDTLEALPDLKLMALDLSLEYESALAELRKFEATNE